MKLNKTIRNRRRKMKLYVIRHGLTKCNVEHKYNGHLDEDGEMFIGDEGKSFLRSELTIKNNEEYK